MNYTEIETFLAVVEYGSISNAANQLFVSQTTVSSRLRTLEAELGVPLLERSKGSRSVKLTIFGSRLVPIAKKWGALWRETAECLAGEEHVTLNIAANTSIVSYIFPNVVKNFSVQNPGVYLTVKPFHPEECQRLIQNGTVDLAVVTRSQYSVEVAARPMYVDKYVFLSGTESIYPSVIHPKDLSVKREIYVDWNLAFIQWHSHWFGSAMPKLFSGSVGVMERVLKESRDMWSVTPMSVAKALQERSKMKISELREAPEGRTGYLLHRSTNGLSNIQQKFIHIMRDTLIEQDIRWIFQAE